MAIKPRAPSLVATLTWLIHTSVLPSNWNLSKIFAVTGLLEQVHMVKKNHFWNSSMRKPFSCNSFYFLVLRKITISVIKMTIFRHGGISEIFILTICTWPNEPVRANILPRFQFEGKTDKWISQVRRVKWNPFVQGFFSLLQWRIPTSWFFVFSHPSRDTISTPI